MTTHDPRRIAFSENTTIHECLLICRRQPAENRALTDFVSLRRMPENADEATEAADAIATGRLNGWGSVCRWPSERVRAGDWKPVQWYEGALAEAAWELEENGALEPAGLRYEIGPDGRSVQDAFEVGDRDAPDAVRGFHSVSGQLRRTILGEPDVWYRPKSRPRKGREGTAERCRQGRSHLLVPMRLNTVSGRLTGLWTPEPSFGWWVPVSVDNEDRAKALAVWWNTTPARLMLLNRRGKTLTYPTWQVAHLREIRIPRPDNPAWNALREAFDQVCDMELLPMRQAEECGVRRTIDEAAAQVLGVEPETLSDWRQRLAAEPTISNQLAPA